MGITLHSKDNTLVLQDDGSYLEADPGGVAIGRWHQGDGDEWIFEEFPQQGEFPSMPQTGGMPGSLILPAIGLALIAAGVFLNKRKSGKIKD